MDDQNFKINFTWKIPAAGLGLLWLFVLLSPWLGYKSLPRSMKWSSGAKGPLSALRASLGEAFSPKTATDGYNKYSKNGQIFTAPNLNFRPQVLLPQGYIKWLLSQPEEVLSHSRTPADTHSLNHIFPLFDDTVHLDFLRVLQQDLTRNIPAVEDDLLEELQLVLDETFGHVDDEAWTEIEFVEMFEIIIFRLCLRMFVGLPHCRNAEILYYTKKVARSLGVATVVTAQIVPWPLRPFIGLLTGLPVYYFWLRLSYLLEPAFRDRLVNIKRHKVEPNNGYKMPASLMSWMVDSAINDPVAKYVTPWQMIFRYCIVSVFPIDTLIAVGTNIILDLLNTDPECKVHQTLHEEAEVAFASEPPAQRSKSMSLNLMDSAVRESLRLNGLSPRSLHRLVAAKDGVTLPDGQVLSKGTWIGVQAADMHKDDQIYDDPTIFKPFRFVSKENDGRKMPSAASTSDKFIVFGHGRHSCPGRWFAVHTLKTVFSRLIMDYEFQPLNKRPGNTIVGHSNIPSLSLMLMIRKRKHA